MLLTSRGYCSTNGPARPRRCSCSAVRLCRRFPGSLLGGTVDTLRFERDRRSTVLYFFSPTCGWCARNVDNRKALLKLKGAEYRFVGLTLAREDSVQAYLSESGLDLPTCTRIPQDVVEAYKLAGTPTTIVVSPQSHVVKSWPGAYVEQQAKEVGTFFHVTLPGLRAAPRSP
jgi:peroxiredoxin